MYLITLAVGGDKTKLEKTIAQAVKIFSPLAIDLWFAVLVACIFAGISMFFVEDISWDSKLKRLVPVIAIDEPGKVATVATVKVDEHARKSAKSRWSALKQTVTKAEKALFMVTVERAKVQLDKTQWLGSLFTHANRKLLTNRMYDETMQLLVGASSDATTACGRVARFGFALFRLMVS